MPSICMLVRRIVQILIKRRELSNIPILIKGKPFSFCNGDDFPQWCIDDNDTLQGNAKLLR